MQEQLPIPENKLTVKDFKQSMFYGIMNFLIEKNKLGESFLPYEKSYGAYIRKVVSAIMVDESLEQTDKFLLKMQKFSDIPSYKFDKDDLVNAEIRDLENTIRHVLDLEDEE